MCHNVGLDLNQLEISQMHLKVVVLKDVIHLS
jgi:hypothetical protein